MGREKKILLGLLGLLAGVFVGVLSMKLFVPRPPAGTGPDVLPEITATSPQERVEPPTPSPDGWDFAAAPPLVPDTTAESTDPFAARRFAAAPATSGGGSRFSTPTPAEPSSPPAREDAAVAPASFDDPSESPEAESLAPAAPPPTLPPAPIPVAGAYLVQAGDSWWAVAERAYGDGRLYRALFAWNRSRDPRISLAPGTQLDVPPLARLEAAWPRLLPPAPR